MKISDKGIELLKELEGRVLDTSGHWHEPYHDQAGKLTMGYGHLIKDTEYPKRLSEIEATDLLKKDLERFEDCINEFVVWPLHQNEFDALVIFCFNIGTAAFKRSTLLKILNLGSHLSISQPSPVVKEWRKWNKITVEEGKFPNTKIVKRVSQGLKNRREKEIELFLKKELDKPKSIWYKLTEFLRGIFK